MAKCKITRDETKQIVSVAYTGLPILTINVQKLSPEIQKHLLYYGLGRRLSDAGAAPKGTPLNERAASVKRVLEQLAAGNWPERARKAARGEARPRGGLLLRALAEYLSKDRTIAGKPVKGMLTTTQDARVRFEKLDPAKRKALRSHPAIVEIVEKLKAARPKPVPAGTVDDLLA